MTDTVLDFKGALLKSQPSAATANVFKPSTGDAGTDGKKEQDKVKCPIFYISHFCYFGVY